MQLRSLECVQVHIEPRHEDVHTLSSGDLDRVARQIEAAAALTSAPGVHDVEVLVSPDGYVVTVYCYLAPDMPIVIAHAITAEQEKAVRENVPNVYRVTVHPDPRRLSYISHKIPKTRND